MSVKGVWAKGGVSKKIIIVEYKHTIQIVLLGYNYIVIIDCSGLKCNPK